MAEHTFDTSPVTFRIADDLLKKFDDKSHKMGYTRAESIRELIRRFVGANHD